MHAFDHKFGLCSYIENSDSRSEWPARLKYRVIYHICTAPRTARLPYSLHGKYIRVAGMDALASFVSFVLQSPAYRLSVSVSVSDSMDSPGGYPMMFNDVSNKTNTFRPLQIDFLFPVHCLFYQLSQENSIRRYSIIKLISCEF